MVASHARVLARYPYHSKAGCHLPAARIGEALFVCLLCIQQVEHNSALGVVLLGSFTSLVYHKCEGCGLGRDFSEPEAEQKILEERGEILRVTSVLPLCEVGLSLVTALQEACKPFTLS